MSSLFLPYFAAATAAEDLKHAQNPLKRYITFPMQFGIRHVRATKPQHFAVNRRATCLRRRQLFQHDHAGAFARDHARTSLIKRPARLRRIAILGRHLLRLQRVNRLHRQNARTGRPGHHHVRVPALNRPKRFADR